MKKALTTAGTPPTEKMREFGQYLQELRAASADEIRGALRRKRRRLAKKDPYIQEEVDEEIPDSFRAQQQLARRLRMGTKSLRQVAAALGISKNTVHEYEMGKKYPSAEFVYEFCAVLQRPADEAINKWVECHPNPIVARHMVFGHFNRFIGGETLAGCPNLPDPEVLSFIETAIVFSVPVVAIRNVNWGEAWCMARAAAMLIDLALLKGKGPDRTKLKELIKKEIDPQNRFLELGFPPFDDVRASGARSNKR